MAAKKIKQDDELEKLRLYTMEELEKIAPYSRKHLDRFRREGVLQTRKLNNGKVVTTLKWIRDFYDAISDGQLEFD